MGSTREMCSVQQGPHFQVPRACRKVRFPHGFRSAGQVLMRAVLITTTLRASGKGHLGENSATRAGCLCLPHTYRLLLQPHKSVEICGPRHADEKPVVSASGGHCWNGKEHGGTWRGCPGRGLNACLREAGAWVTMPHGRPPSTWSFPGRSQIRSVPR